jgi:hypothetical protein
LSLAYLLGLKQVYFHHNMVTMKKIFLTCIAVIGAVVIAIAQQKQRSVIRVALSDDSRLAISIDDRYYDKQGRSLTVGDLPAGRHRLKIYSFVPYKNRKGGRARTLYSGMITISEGTITYLTYDINSDKLRAKTEYLETNNWNNETDATRPMTPRDHTYSNQLNGQDISALKAAVDERITDTDKQKLVQSVLEGSSYTTEQVRTIISWFNFESTKLDVAKWAYKGVSDKQNYWKVESDFTYTSSKDEFNTYISSQK